MPLPQGTRLGRYEILAPLGAGGMGEVYRARDPQLERDVAIKVLPEEMVGDPTALARFAREARSIAALSHPNILAVYDVGAEGRVSWVVTELLEGRTLAAALAAGPLPARQAFQIAAGVADGLAAAHARGIVHRDVKPANLMLTPDGRVKILDFGLAGARPASPGSGESQSTAGLTSRGTILGTVGYFSPEQARGEPADARSDLFALGCVLYEMLAGVRAFPGESAADALVALLRDEPSGLAEGSEAIPAAAREILRHCLEKDPERRFQNARDLVVLLRGLAAEDAPARAPERSPSGAAGAAESLAVLPFESSGASEDIGYLSEGIAESLTRALSSIPGLRVISRSAVAGYRGRDADPLRAGRELAVGSVLTGRVVARGDRVSISAELVDVADRRQIWGQRYQRPMDDIFSLQEHLAAEIAGQLRPRLSGAASARPVLAHPPNGEAYQLYLKGRYWWNRRPEEGFVNGIEYFQKSIEADPSFALSYAGLADCYITLGSWETGMLPPNEAFLKARTLARKGVELDERSAETHASLGYSLFHYDWNFRQAEESLRRAITLDDGYAAAHHWYSHLLLPLGRIEESLVQSQAAVAIDPNDFIMNAHLAWHHYFAGNYDLAIEAAERLPSFISDHFWSPFFGGLACEAKGTLGEAIERLGRAVARSPNAGYAAAALAHACALAGDADRARTILQDLGQRGQRQFVPAYDLAIVHLGLGEIEQVFPLLDRAFDERSSWIIHINVDPRLEPLRKDPRFQALVRRVGLPTSSSSPSPRGRGPG
jgi:serine/threonine protein kinase/Tfp pilus assembly protein PilF